MNDNPNCRPDSAVNFAQLARLVYLQGWRVLFDQERLAALAGLADRTAGGAADELFAALRDRLAASFDRLELQLRASCLMQETAFATLAQLDSLQDLLGAALEPAELGWLGGLPSRLGPFQPLRQRPQALASALIELRQAQEVYLDLNRRAAEDAIASFEGALGGRGAPLGLKELYELWLNCGEQAYERMLASEAYSVAFAGVSNASAALAAQAQDALDELLSAFKLPTRREMLSTQKRLQELRRRQRAAERALPAQFEALRQEMSQLRTELDLLRKPASASEAPRPASAGKRRRHHVV